MSPDSRTSSTWPFETQVVLAPVIPIRKTLEVTMATTSLTDWLLRIVGVTGLIGGSFGSGGQYGGGSGGSVSGGGGDGVGGNAENAEARDTIGTGLAELAAGEAWRR
ncbi:hypothetical protein Pst134EB_022126 [Puccinia striiformis f. sp. tritici]|nr:hypothetical protein Pst134EB_022126 [Puccinia striiformis f. sp. tritici]